MTGLADVTSRPVLGVETGTAELEKTSGMWFRWNEGEGHWAPSRYCVASPDQWFPKFGTWDNPLGTRKKIWKLAYIYFFPLKIKDLGFSNIYMFIILK